MQAMAEFARNMLRELSKAIPNENEIMFVKQKLDANKGNQSKAHAKTMQT